MTFFSFYAAFFYMIGIVSLTNYLVLFPINDWLTCGAFAYPISYLITELTNRFYGSKSARQVVYVGFLFGALLSAWLATPKIAIGSATAFLVGQLLDIFIFSRFRQSSWWYAPLCASVFATTIDSTIFWTLAFWGENLPIMTWAIGDLGVKLALDLLMLMPFRLMIRYYTPIRS